MEIDLAPLSEADTYALLTQTIIPRPIAWVLTDNATSQENDWNLAPFSFFNGISSEPPMVMFSVGSWDVAGRTKDTLAPVEFEGSPGDVIRIVASDINSCDLMIDALVLHWGTGESQALNAAECASACVDATCYDGTYSGPWPGIFLDESYTIAIP